MSPAEIVASAKAASQQGGTGSLRLAFRLARRELRAGLKGFYIFITCLTLGVAAISGIGSVSQSMLEGLRSNGRALLGGDMELRLVHRPASAEQRAWLEARAEVSELVTFRTMARVPDEAAAGGSGKRMLVELRAVDRLYPFYGAVGLAPDDGLGQALTEKDGSWGAVADANLLRRLGVALGERIRIGSLEYQVRALLEREPDMASRNLILGPTFMVARESLGATGLEQPGSLLDYSYRLRLADGSGIAALGKDLLQRFPQAGWRIRDTTEATPGLSHFIERLTLFLTLVGLTSLLVGGVGVSNAVGSYLDGKVATIATLKCLGASNRLIFRTYLAQVMAIALVGVAAGLIIGAAAPFVVNAILGDRLGWQNSGGLYPLPLALGAAFGLLTAFAFSLWPLARAESLPAASLFRQRITPTKGRVKAWAWLAIAGSALGLTALALAAAEDRWLTLYFAVGAAAALLIFRLTAFGLIIVARRVPRARDPGLRLAVTNLHRPGSPAASVVMSLGLGLTVLVAIALIEGNLARWVDQSLPDEAPGFYFIDIQPYQIEDFDRLVRGTVGVRDLKRVPMLRGRITAINGTAPEELDIPSEVSWVFRGDRGLTWTREQPEGTRLTAGDWWPADYQGPPLVSLDADVGNALDLGPGDRMTINLLGRDIEVEIANLREIDWTALSLNFVMVLSPGQLESAPQSYVATVKADPAVEDALEIAITDRFANVSSIRVKEAVASAGALITKVAIAIRVTAGVALLAGVLVLAGAVAAGHQRRVYDAVVLKVLGATRRMVGRAFLLEYGILGLATAGISALLGSIAAYVVLTEIMELQFFFLPGAVAGTAGLALAITILLGFAGTWRALSQKSAPLLRNE